MRPLFPSIKLSFIPLAVSSLLISGCGGGDTPPSRSSSTYVQGGGNYQYQPIGSRPVSNTSGNHSTSHTAASGGGNRSKINGLYRSARVEQQILSRSSRSRNSRSMKPLYITIHSTQNWSKGADARRHALALKNGALGKIGWHFTTDQNVSVQHLPTNEQGNHAENYHGPGNKYSIGIEMCEHPGNSRSATIERTAKLTAYLMHKHNLPISRVVPHYKWPRRGYAKANKDCPHFLLDNGRPGRKWQWFQNKVQGYYNSAY